MTEPADLDQTDHAKRDSESLRILGFFFTVLGLLVLVGTLATLSSDPKADEASPTDQTASIDKGNPTDSIEASEDAKISHSSLSVKKKRGAIVNAVSGIVLATVGGVMLLLTRKSGKSKS